MRVSAIKTWIQPDHVGKVGFLMVHASDIDAVAKYGDGQMLRLTVSNPRSIEHHNKFMAILRMVADNKDGWTVEKLIAALKEELGYYERFTTLKGIVKTLYYSINFESMNQDEFQEFYDKSIPLLDEFHGAPVDVEENWIDYL